MSENETTAPVRVFDRAYINGKFVTPLEPRSLI